MTKNKVLLIFVVLLISTFVSISLAEQTETIDITEFDAAQYVTGEKDKVDLYAGISFDMFPEQAIVEAGKVGFHMEREKYSDTFTIYTPESIYVDEYYKAELYCNFDTNGDQLWSVRCLFDDASDRIYKAIEQILIDRYGETPYTSDTGASIGEITSSSMAGMSLCSTIDTLLYSQRVIKQSNGKYVVLNHNVYRLIIGKWGFKFHELVISIVNP